VHSHDAPRGLRAAPAADPEARPALFDQADAAMTVPLESLDGAKNYARWIFSMIEPHLGPRVLEVGAGLGTFTELLAPGRRLTATEMSARCLAMLRERYAEEPAVEIVDGDIDAASAKGPFDAAVMLNVLEHIEDDRKALRELAATLVPGGRLVVFVPALQRLYSDFDREVGHHRRYQKEDLVRAAEEAGFHGVEARYVNTLGAVAWWVTAKRLRLRPIRPWSTMVYDRVAVPVLRRVERSWEPPFGQSVFCVARRP
jgi:SAM-dependent methyltransferase